MSQHHVSALRDYPSFSSLCHTTQSPASLASPNLVSGYVVIIRIFPPSPAQGLFRALPLSPVLYHPSSLTDHPFLSRIVAPPICLDEFSLRNLSYSCACFQNDPPKHRDVQQVEAFAKQCGVDDLFSDVEPSKDPAGDAKRFRTLLGEAGESLEGQKDGFYDVNRQTDEILHELEVKHRAHELVMLKFKEAEEREWADWKEE